MENKDTCLYIHTRKTDDVVFYVGIGNSRRPYSIDSRNRYWKSTVKKHGYNVKIIKTDMTWSEACGLEINMIAFYGRKDLGLGTLVNMTDGGEGSKNPSEEARKKMGIPSKNRVITDELRKKMSESQKAIGNKPPSCKGKLMGENQKKKISLSNIGKKFSNETRKKISLSAKNKVVSDETKKKLSDYNKKIGRKPPIQYGNKSAAKKVICIVKNTIYDSIKDAANDNGINLITLRSYLNGIRFNKTSLRYL